MKATVLNPAKKKGNKSKMAYVRSFKKKIKKANPVHKASRKRVVSRKPVAAKSEFSAMRKAHTSISSIISQLSQKKSADIIFDQADKVWLNYILKKI
jgi:hypothetical protein